MVLYSSSSAPCMHQQVLSKHAQEDTRVDSRFTPGTWALANLSIQAHLAVWRPTFGSSLVPLVDLTCWGAPKCTGSRGLLQRLAAAQHVSYGCVSGLNARHASWTQSRTLHQGKEPGGLLLPGLHQQAFSSQRTRVQTSKRVCAGQTGDDPHHAHADTPESRTLGGPLGPTMASPGRFHQILLRLTIMYRITLHKGASCGAV